MIDAGLTGGYGSGSSLLVKGATKAGINVTPKAAAFLNSAWSGAVIDGGLRTGFAIHQENTWQNEKYAKEDCKNLLGDQDAQRHIQKEVIVSSVPILLEYTSSMVNLKERSRPLSHPSLIEPKGYGSCL